MPPKGSMPSTGSVKGLSHIKTRPQGNGQDFAKMYINFMQLGRYRRTKQLFDGMVKGLDSNIKACESELQTHCLNAGKYLQGDKVANRNKENDSVPFEF